MSIEKLNQMKDEYMISGLGGKGEFLFSFLLFFYLITNLNPYFPKNIVIS